MYTYNFLPEELLDIIANANLIDPDGKHFDPRDLEFDRSAGWFRAHPEFPRLLEEFKKIDIYLYNDIKEDIVLIPNCIIPYIRLLNDNRYISLEFDIVKAINTSVSEIIYKPIDEHLLVEEQLILEKQKHQLILNKIAELNDAYRDCLI